MRRGGGLLVVPSLPTRDGKRGYSLKPRRPERSSQPTYKGWKFASSSGNMRNQLCSQPTYKGWKRNPSKPSQRSKHVPSLPTRDGNWQLLLCSTTSGSVPSLPSRDGKLQAQAGPVHRISVPSLPTRNGKPRSHGRRTARRWTFPAYLQGMEMERKGVVQGLRLPRSQPNPQGMETSMNTSTAALGRAIPSLTTRDGNNGFNCRCTVQPIRRHEANRRGIKPHAPPKDVMPDKGFAYNPAVDFRRLWVDGG